MLNIIAVCFLTIFVIILITFFVYKLSKYSVLCYDDLFVVMPGENFKILSWQYFSDIYHGRYISDILVKFIGFFIPNWLNIHPNEWIQTGGGVIKGLFVSLFVFMLADFAFIFKKNKLFLPVLAFLCYIFYQYCFVFQWADVSYISFFGSTFPLIFYFLLWKNLILKILNNEKTDNIKILFYSFLTGISMEFTAISSFFALLFFIVLRKKFLKENIKDLFKVFLTLSSGMVLMFTNGGFINAANGKGTLCGIKNTIDMAITILPEYLQGYKTIFLSEFLIYTVFIIILSVLIWYFSGNNNRVRTEYLIYSILLGSYCFYSLLLFGGRHFEGYCYVIHFDIIMQMKILFLSIILFEIGYLFKNNKLFYLVLFIPVVFITNYSDFYTIFCKFIKYGTVTFTSYKKDFYTNRYMHERMFLWYSYNNIKPIIVKDWELLLSEKYIQTLYPDVEKYHYKKLADTKEEAYKFYLDNGGAEIKETNPDDIDWNKLKNKNFILGKEK